MQSVVKSRPFIIAARCEHVVYFSLVKADSLSVVFVSYKGRRHSLPCRPLMKVRRLQRLAFLCDSASLSPIHSFDSSTWCVSCILFTFILQVLMQSHSLARRGKELRLRLTDFAAPCAGAILHLLSYASLIQRRQLDRFPTKPRLGSRAICLAIRRSRPSTSLKARRGWETVQNRGPEARGRMQVDMSEGAARIRDWSAGDCQACPGFEGRNKEGAGFQS